MTRVLLALALLHAAMFGYDLQNPDRFLRADRALERIDVIRGFEESLRSGDPLGYLPRHGIVGDWLPQAALYAVGGPPLVIAAQIVLMLFSVYWVFGLAKKAGLDEKPAIAAALIYALLPHTLVFTHELATEAIFVPLVIAAFRFSSGWMMGFATLVRPLTAIWPFIHAALLKRPSYLIGALVPLLAWMAFIYAATDEFGIGRSGHDLGNNLYYRMQRMASSLPESERPPVKAPGQTKATLGEYFAFVAAHPGAAAAHSFRDVIAVGFKSGVERILIDYLDLYPESRSGLQDADSGWRSRVEKGGARAMLELFLAQPGLVGGAAAGALAFTAFMILAALGAMRWARGPERLALVAFVLYIIATGQAVDAAQSRHRAPAEFALCLLAVAGWQSLKRRRPQPQQRMRIEPTFVS